MLTTPHRKGTPMELISKRLTLRPWLDSDAPALYNLARSPKVGPAAGWTVHESVGQSLDILRNILRGPEQYAITLRDTGELIGAIGLKTREDCPYLSSDNAYSVGYFGLERSTGATATLPRPLSALSSMPATILKPTQFGPITSFAMKNRTA